MEVNGNQKGDILKNVGSQMVSGPIDLHSMDKNTMEVNGTQKWDILKNVGNQMVSEPIDLHSVDTKYNGSQCHMKKKKI